jgi:death on curing protein
LAIEETNYLSYADAVLIHILLMRFTGDTIYGVFDRSLVESALARSQQVAAYEKADIIRQAATLCYGLIKNHPWIGGNKRTATAIVREFLKRNRIKLVSPTSDIVEMVLAVESDRWEVDEIETWLRQHAIPVR